MTTQPMFEQLEPRTMFSGTVTVTYSPTSVSIVGDTAGNQINIQPAVGKVSVTSHDANTTIVTKGVAPAVGQAVSFTVKMGSGDDTVYFLNMQGKNVTADLGEGADDLVFTGASIFAGNLNLKAGNGSNIIVLQSGTYGGNVTLSGKDDGDLFSVAGTFGKKVSISTGKGADYVYISVNAGFAYPSMFSGSVDIKLGDGDDIVSMAGQHAGNNVAFNHDVKIDMGTGNDRFNIDSTNIGLSAWFGRKFSLQLGTGNDYTDGIRTSGIVFAPTATFTLRSAGDIKTNGLIQGLRSFVWDQGTRIDVKW